MSDKTHVISPLVLKILIHFYSSPRPYKSQREDIEASHGDWGKWTDPEVKGINYLKEKGLLVDVPPTSTSTESVLFAITDKGRFYIDHLLSVPFPETSYRIP